jgi:SAM-dependent methyltransferase
MDAFNSRIRRILRERRRSASILDVGMGDGVFLAALKQRGWEVTGIDIEPSVIAYAQSRLGIQNCMVADAERDCLPAGPFDVVTLWGMLQLAYRPEELLLRLKTILAPAAILAIGVSNIESAGARIFRSHWHGLGLPRHLIHFEPATMIELLGRTGYRVLGIYFETPGWIVNGSVNASLPLPWLLGKAARFTARSVLRCMGPTRWGDTFTVLAKPAAG